MALPKVSVEHEFLMMFWPPETLDEDDYIRRSQEEEELSATYDDAAERLSSTKERVSESSSGETTDATIEKLEQAIEDLKADSANSKASSENLALRGQSMFNLKNILNTIAWGLHEFKSKVLTFFFGDPVTASLATETAEAAAAAAGGTAKSADDIAEMVTTSNVQGGLDLLSNMPDMFAPMVDDLGPGDNTTAGMFGTELYDNAGNLLGTLGRDGALVPNDMGMGMGSGMGSGMSSGMGSGMDPSSYYGPVYDQGGQPYNQLPPQQVFGGQGGSAEYTPQGWGYMPGVPQGVQDVMNQVGAEQMVNPSSYGYNGTPQGMTDALVQGGQQMVATGHPNAPTGLIEKFTSNLGQLSEPAANLVGMAHEMFGVEPPEAEGSENLGQGDEKAEEGAPTQSGVAGGAPMMPPQGPGEDEGEGAHAQQGGGDEPEVEAEAEVNGEPVPVDVDVAPEPEPEPAPEDVAAEKSEPAAPRPLFSGHLNIDTPLFKLDSSLEIGTHLTSGAAVPTLASTPPAFTPAAAPAAPVGGMGGGFVGGMAGGAMAGAAAGAAATAGSTAASGSSGSTRVGVGKTAYDSEEKAKKLVNGGHGSAEVAPVVLRNTDRDDHELSGVETDDVVPVAPVEDAALSMLPPMVARGARVLARIAGEMTARRLSGPAAVAVYDDGSAVFTTADGLGAVVSARPMAAVPLMDELAAKYGAGNDAAGEFISDWVGMDDPVTVMALAIEVGLLDTPEVLVTTQTTSDDRELPGDAQAISPSVLAKVPPADVSVSDDTLDAEEVAEIIAPVAAGWQYPETGLSSAELVDQLRARRWSEQDSGTALIATIWWLVARAHDALEDGDLVTATRLGLMIAGLPEPKN